MGAARGIAGSVRPEVEGIFLEGSLDGAWWFANFPAQREPLMLVDVWEVQGPLELVDDPAGSGYSFFPGAIRPERLLLVEADLDPKEAARRRGLNDPRK